MPRSVEQTDRLLAHRLREQAVGGRTRLVNQMRGLLREYGVVLPQGMGALERALPALLEDGEHGLTVTCLQQAGGPSLSRHAVGRMAGAGCAYCGVGGRY